MPVLSNARHEIFCQSVASGRTLSESYTDAGFAKNGSNASTLNKKKQIKLRIEEILSERAAETLKKTAREASYSRDILLTQLEEAREIARKAMNGSAMAMATMGMAKILGLIVDRREVGEAGKFEKMTDEELLEAAKTSAEELGLPDPSNVLQFRNSDAS